MKGTFWGVVINSFSVWDSAIPANDLRASHPMTFAKTCEDPSYGSTEVILPCPRTLYAQMQFDRSYVHPTVECLAAS